MQRNGVEGSTLDLVVRQNHLNKEYLELRQDGEENPPSATEPTASARGWVKHELGSVKVPKGGQCGKPMALTNVNPPREYTQMPTYYLKYHYFVFIYNHDARMRVCYLTHIPWGHSRWHFFAVMPALFSTILPTHPAPESELHVFFTVFVLVPEQWWVYWSCSRNTCWMNGLTEYHISPFPQCSKMRGQVWQKRRRVKKWVRQATWGSSLKFKHLELAYSPFLGQERCPCPLHTHFRNLTWREQWTSVESPISLRISLLSIPLLEMSGSNFVLQLYLLPLC